MIHVLALIETVPGQRAAALDAFRANVPNVLAEDGCIEYGAAVDTEGVSFAAPIGPDAFAVVEKWASLDALKAHARAPHMAAYGSATKDLVAKRTLFVLTPA